MSSELTYEDTILTAVAEHFRFAGLHSIFWSDESNTKNLEVYSSYANNLIFQCAASHVYVKFDYLLMQIDYVCFFDEDENTIEVCPFKPYKNPYLSRYKFDICDPQSMDKAVAMIINDKNKVLWRRAKIFGLVLIILVSAIMWWMNLPH